MSRSCEADFLLFSNFFNMKDEKIFLTSEGLEKIKSELENLKEKRRPTVVERLALARSQGDLSENTEYAAAREELAFVDGRIEELEDIVSKASVIQKTGDSYSNVGLGSKVTVKIDGTETVYEIVGEWEANPAKKKVSHSSPLGKALIGKKIGEEVEFEAPAGKILLKIIRIG